MVWGHTILVLITLSPKIMFECLLWLCWLLLSFIIIWVSILSIIQISSCDFTIFENNEPDFLRYCFFLRLHHIMLFKPLCLWLVIFFGSLTFNVLRPHNSSIIHLILFLHLDSIMLWALTCTLSSYDLLSDTFSLLSFWMDLKL